MGGSHGSLVAEVLVAGRRHARAAEPQRAPIADATWGTRTRVARSLSCLLTRPSCRPRSTSSLRPPAIRVAVSTRSPRPSCPDSTSSPRRAEVASPGSRHDGGSRCGGNEESHPSASNPTTADVTAIHRLAASRLRGRRLSRHRPPARAPSGDPRQGQRHGPWREPNERSGRPRTRAPHSGGALGVNGGSVRALRRRANGTEERRQRPR
jgi:hypothetical protein